MQKRVAGLASRLEGRIRIPRRRHTPRVRRSLLAVSGGLTLLVALVGVPLIWLAARLDRRLPFGSGWDTPTGEPPPPPEHIAEVPPADARHEHLERHGPHGI